MFRTHSEIWLVSDHPVRSSKEASRYLPDVAATPPLGGGEYLAQKICQANKKRGIRSTEAQRRANKCSFYRAPCASVFTQLLSNPHLECADQSRKRRQWTQP